MLEEQQNEILEGLCFAAYFAMKADGSIEESEVNAAKKSISDFLKSKNINLNIDDGWVKNVSKFEASDFDKDETENKAVEVFSKNEITEDALKCIISVIAADGVITEEERNLALQIGIKAGISPKAIFASIDSLNLKTDEDAHFLESHSAKDGRLWQFYDYENDMGGFFKVKNPEGKVRRVNYNFIVDDAGNKISFKDEYLSKLKKVIDSGEWR